MSSLLAATASMGELALNCILLVILKGMLKKISYAIYIVLLNTILIYSYEEQCQSFLPFLKLQIRAFYAQYVC
jgi:hypothetical protein